RASSITAPRTATTSPSMARPCASITRAATSNPLNSARRAASRARATSNNQTAERHAPILHAGATLLENRLHSNSGTGEAAMARVAFLGLGVMGFPMAGHLKKAGHEVTVYNRTSAKAEAWVREYGGRSAPTPGGAAQGAEIVFACVGNDADVREVALGSGGAFASMERGTVFVDHTSASASLARELDAAARERGLGFVDAPVSGGQAGAEKGILTVMAGGEEAAYRVAEP